MTEEEFFINNYPDSCYGDRPLSPHWDFFQDGVEFGERKSEEKIQELETQIEKMKCCQNCENWNWKHSKCEKKLKGNCFKHSKWVLRKILSKEYE